MTTPLVAYEPANSVKPETGYNASGLAGKSVIVTGGANGIGRSITEHFLSAGAFVTVGDLHEDRGTELVSALGGESKVAFVKCNVNVWADQMELFKIALKRSPAHTLDIVVANAGVGLDDSIFLDQVGPDGEPLEPHLKTLQTNLIGTTYTIKLAMHYLQRQPQGPDRDRCLIVTDSLAGYVDQPGAPEYCSSKWGVRGLMRSLRRTLPYQQMRINMLAPSFIATDIMSEKYQALVKSWGVEFALVEDAAEAALHLASDTSLNGRSLAIVPRTLDPRGYFDFKHDDFEEGDILAEWQKLAVKAIEASFAK